MWMLPRVELDLAPRVRAELQIAGALDPLDGRQFAVSEFLFVVRGRELHAVALRELALAVAVDRHTLQAARIVAQLFAAVPLHCERVAFAVHARNSRVFSWLDAERLATFRVAQYVATLVVPRVLPVRARHILPRVEHMHALLVIADLSLALHRTMDGLVDLTA